jgi:formylmethanofuran dehydrogenase subunit E
MGIYAAELLEVDLRSGDRPLYAVVETDGCFSDGVSVATGCWLGRRNLRLVDHGKVAITAINLVTQRAVRVRPHSLARIRAATYAPNAPSRWHSQLIGYQRMPITELVSAESVQIPVPVAALVGQESQRIDCAGCGEEVLNSRHVTVGRRRLCRRCAGDPDYLEAGSATFVSAADFSQSRIVEAA